MYNRTIIEELLAFIHDNEGVGNKNRLQAIVAEKYNLQKRQKKDAVYFCDFFAIRFCSSKNKRDTFSNTVMSIKHIKQNDSIPLFVCVVGPDRNYIHLANASFIKRLSHSSSAFFRENNLVGNINYPDIIMEKTRIQNRWAGRNSRGTAQFNGHSLEYFLEDSHVCIEIQPSVRFLEDLLSAGEEDSTKNDSKT